MRIKGLNTVLNALKFDDSRIEAVLTQAGDNILRNTQSAARGVDGTIANSFNTFVRREGDTIVVNVGSDLSLAAYSEWGTGDYVIVPPETTDAYTMLWFVNGRGSLRPHPAIIPAFRIERPKVIEELNKALQR